MFLNGGTYSFEMSNETYSDDHLSIISNPHKDPSDSISYTNSSYLGRFGSTKSFSESSSLELSNLENESIIIKNEYQDYKGMLDIMNETSQKLKEKESIVNNSAKGPFAYNKSQKSQEILHSNAFAVPGRFFCKQCLIETISVIRFVPLELGF